MEKASNRIKRECKAKKRTEELEQPARKEKETSLRI